MNKLDNQKKGQKSFFVKTFLSTVPVLAGYIVLGIGFGILLHDKGYGVLWALFMSIFMYAGSMQYLACELLASSASIIATVVTTVLVQARHLFYGISLIDRYRGAGLKKIYMIHALTDETYSLVSTTDLPDGVDSHKYYFTVSLLDHIYWITGCVLGSILGSVLTIDTKGVDFALTALFVCIFTDQWLNAKDRFSAIIGVVSALICLLIFGADNFLIPTMFLIILLLPATKRFRKENSDV